LPNKPQHLKKAATNESLALSLNLAVPGAPDWAITMLFYTAVHYVEAFFSKTGQHLKRHKLRVSAIQANAQLRPIYKDYRELQTYSETARYQAVFFTATDVAPVKQHLQNVKALLTPLL
jgi:hypothetical protein